MELELQTTQGLARVEALEEHESLFEIAPRDLGNRPDGCDFGHQQRLPSSTRPILAEQLAQDLRPDPGRVSLGDRNDGSGTSALPLRADSVCRHVVVPLL